MEVHVYRWRSFLKARGGAFEEYNTPDLKTV